MCGKIKEVPCAAQSMPSLQEEFGSLQVAAVSSARSALQSVQCTSFRAPAQSHSTRWALASHGVPTSLHRNVACACVVAIWTKFLADLLCRLLLFARFPKDFSEVLQEQLMERKRDTQMVSVEADLRADMTCYISAALFLPQFPCARRAV